MITDLQEYIKRFLRKHNSVRDFASLEQIAPSQTRLGQMLARANLKDNNVNVALN
ncbi:hypothetical protein IQ255_08125 [Pleurocapsales cyanobacterium LEGE 10410]|nr:hypothetical protein [Pleurocapsales cyanobacterium LEGE 10410]